MSTNTLAIYRSSNLTAKDSDSGLEKFLQQAYAAPILTEEEEYRLATRLRDANDLDAAHKLVHSYLRYVLKIAREYKNYHLSMADLVQEGTVGLMQAVKKFDPNRGTRLATYAVWWIRAAIHEFILRSWRMVKIATTQLKRQLFFKLRQAKESAAALSMEEAEELAAKFGTDTETIIDVDSRLSSPDASLNQPVLDEDSTEMIEMIADQRPNQEHAILDTEQQSVMQQMIESGMAKLNERERLIIAARFLSEKPETLELLGERLSVSRERVRQLEKAALEKLKRFFARSPYTPDLLLET